MQSHKLNVVIDDNADDILDRYGRSALKLPPEVIEYVRKRYMDNDCFKSRIAIEATKKFKLRVIPEFIYVLSKVNNWGDRPTRSGLPRGRPLNYNEYK